MTTKSNQGFKESKDPLSGKSNLHSQNATKTKTPTSKVSVIPQTKEMKYKLIRELSWQIANDISQKATASLEKELTVLIETEYLKETFLTRMGYSHEFANQMTLPMKKEWNLMLLLSQIEYHHSASQKLNSLYEQFKKSNPEYK